MSCALCVVRRPCRKQAGEGCEDMKMFVKRNGCGNYSALRNAGVSSGMQDGTKSSISFYYTDWQALIALSCLIQAVISISHFYTNWQALIALNTSCYSSYASCSDVPGATWRQEMRRVDKKGIEHLCRNLAAVLLFSPPFLFALSPSFSGKEKCNQQGQAKSQVLRTKRRRDLKLVQGL